MTNRWIAVYLTATAVAVGIWCWTLTGRAPGEFVQTAPLPAGKLDHAAREHSDAVRGGSETAADSAVQDPQQRHVVRASASGSVPVTTASQTRVPDAAPGSKMAEVGPQKCVGGTCSVPGSDATPCSSCSVIASETESADDPAADGWQTEVVHDHVKHQLKKIAHFLADPHESPTVVDAVAVDSFRLHRLRPERLVRVGDTPELQVFRAGDSQEPLPSGVAELRLSEALADLRSRFPDSTSIRTAFKVFRIEELDDRIRTQTYVEMSGSDESQRQQINVTWTCEWTSEEEPRLLSLSHADYEEVVAGGRALFRDCTVSVLQHNDSYQQQMRFGTDHWCGQIDQRFGIQQNAYHGLAIADVNGDGRDDVYVCQPGGLPNRLYIQNADGTATDVSAASGVDFLRATRCGLFVDLDSDHDQDLVLAMVDSLILMENNGQGQFVWRDALKTNSMLFSVVAADYDNDGAVDLFVCGRGELNSGNTIPIPYHDAKNGGPNLLFRNQGSFRFADVTKATGLDVENSRFSQAAAWEDYDNDGDQDLYVANDFGRNNLYRNDNGRFVDVAAEAGVEDLGPGMSVSWGDYNQDGLPDLYVANMFSSAGGRIAFQSQFRTSEQDDTLAALQRHARGNSLFENLGNGRFRDVSQQADVMMGRWAWSSVFADINNDGRDDLLVANGMVTETRTHDL